MNNTISRRVILALSLPLGALTIIVSLTGLLTPGFYSAETSNWQAQSLGQDTVDLFLIVPCLWITALLIYRNKRNVLGLWGGVVLYLTYTFVLYCFEVHFNRVFLFYCLCLGLSFYSFLYFLFSHPSETFKIQFEKKAVTRFTGWYFIVISVMFYLLWLAELVPSIIHNTTPKSVVESGLFTNGVHVIDLSVFLPAIFITGVLLLRKNTLGLILAPVMLTFFVLMDITIGLLVILLNMKGLDNFPELAVIMGILALVSLSILVWFLRSIKKERVAGS